MTSNFNNNASRYGLWSSAVANRSSDKEKTRRTAGGPLSPTVAGLAAYTYHLGLRATLRNFPPESELSPV